MNVKKGIFLLNFPLGRKKASLSLSVNAIVILILAIVMLGLGLGFIRGMFGKVSAQIEQQIDAEPEPHVPTGANPVTLSRESVITHAGDKEVMKVSAFNPTNGTWFDTTPTINCGNFAVSGEANEKTIEQGKFVTFDLLIGIPSSPPDTYLCQMGIEEKYVKDFTIKIIE